MSVSQIPTWGSLRPPDRFNKERLVIDLDQRFTGAKINNPGPKPTRAWLCIAASPGRHPIKVYGSNCVAADSSCPVRHGEDMMDPLNR